jgi:hypothetical protein
MLVSNTHTDNAKADVAPKIAACRNALYLTEPQIDREALKSAKGNRVDGTCEWIKSNVTYQSWLDGDTNLLWISGGPGRGKTMLSIFLTEELETLAQGSENMMVLFLFCKNEDEKRNTAVNILRGLVYQIVTKRPGLIERHALSSFESPERSRDTLSSLEALWIIFRKLIQDPDLCVTFCVVDGLDECDDSSSRTLVAKLVNFFSSQDSQPTKNAFRLAIVSRKISGLEQAAQVRLDPDNEESVSSDIAQFISVKVQELSRIEGFGDQFLNTVRTALLKRAGGTFLWVGFVINELSKKRTATEVLEALDAMPAGLPAMYSRMLLQIPPSTRPTSVAVLRWVTMAYRPLTLRELAAAVGIQSLPLLSVKQAITDQITLCGPFLMVDQDEVRLIHQSARDYLLRKEPDENPVLEEFRMKSEKAHLELARKCLDYIQNSSGLEPPEFALLERPLLSYASLQWPEHARDCCTHATGLLDQKSPFFQEKSTLRKKWVAYYYTANSGMWSWDRPPFDLLQIACWFGIAAWVPLLAKKSWKSRFLNPANKRNMGRQLPLVIAAEKGHDNVVKLLLATGRAAVKVKDEWHSTPLSYAASNGHKAVVELLLSLPQVDADSRDLGRKTPLMYAAGGGHIAVVKLLLATGKVNADARDFEQQTSLSLAAMGGHEAVVKLLIATGQVDVDARDYRAKTPCYWPLMVDTSPSSGY